MPDKPILFSGPMVRAIMEGRKTMTRRVLKDQPTDRMATGPCRFDEETWIWRHGMDGSILRKMEPAPKHHVGDLLYVRESLYKTPLGANFIADNMMTKADAWPWKRDKLPSIHMPKALSRITLKVTDVRVELLQDITIDDVYAEGVVEYEEIVEIMQTPKGPSERQEFRSRVPGIHDDELSFDYPIDAFADLWDGLNKDRDNGIYAWDKNPWVSVTVFEPIFKNVLEIAKEFDRYL